MVIRDWVVAIAVIYVAVRYALLREQERASMRADLFVSGSCWHYPILPNTVQNPDAMTSAAWTSGA